MPITEHAQFKPYFSSMQFRDVYQKSTGGILVNKHSINTGMPLVVSDIADLNVKEVSALEKNWLFQILSKPAYLFQHHSMTAYACAEAMQFGVIAPGSTLVHFDEHPDMEMYGDINNRSLENLMRLHNKHFMEDSFIWNMVKSGLISQVFWFSTPSYTSLQSDVLIKSAFPSVPFHRISQEELTGFGRGIIDAIPQNQLILDIDYDYFHNLRKEHMIAAITLMLYIARRCGLITQALSPNYISIGISSNLAIDFMRNVNAVN